MIILYIEINMCCVVTIKFYNVSLSDISV